MFQEKRAHLGALPLQGFACYTECERTVADDTCSWWKTSIVNARGVGAPDTNWSAPWNRLTWVLLVDAG